MRRWGRVPPVSAGISALLMIAVHGASLDAIPIGGSEQLDRHIRVRREKRMQVIFERGCRIRSRSGSEQAAGMMLLATVARRKILRITRTTLTG